MTVRTFSMAVLVATALASCGGGQRGGGGAGVRPDELWKLAPPGAIAGAVVTDLGRAADAYKRLRATLEEHPHGATLVSAIGLAFEQSLGADLRDAAGIAAAGIDPRGGLAVFVLPGGDPVVAAVTTGPAGETTLGKLLAGLDAAIDGRVEGGVMKCDAAGKRRVCGYDVAAVGGAAKAGKRGGGELTALLAQKVPAAERGGLIEWLQRVPAAAAAAPAGGVLDVGAAFAGATLTFVAGDVKPTGVVMRLFAADAGRAEAARILGRANRGGPGLAGSARARALATLGDDGVGLLGGSIDFTALHDFFAARDPRVLQGETFVRQAAGFDVVRDVIEPLTGEIAVVSRPAKQGLAVILGARDAAAAKKLVGKVNDAVKTALLALGFLGGMPAGWELDRSDAKDLTPGAFRVVMKGPMLPDALFADDLGRVTLTIVPVGDTVVLALDAELARRAVSRTAADAARFQQRVRAGRTLVASAPMLLWAESFDPLEAIDPQILAQCADFTKPRCGSPPNPLRAAAEARLGEARVRALVEATRYLLDRGEELAIAVELRPQGAAARVEVASGGRTGAPAVAYVGALAQKYSGDFDAFRTTLFGLGQQGPLTSVGRRARLTTEGLRANFSPLQLIIAPPLALLGL